MKAAMLLSVVCGALISSSALHPARVAAEPAPHCSARDIHAGLIVREGDEAAAMEAVSWTSAAGTPRLNQNWVLSGPCARLVAGFELNIFALRTGEIFRIENDARLVPVRGATFPNDAVTPAAAALHPGAFLGAARVTPSVSSEASGDFIGLWRDAEGWVVAGFTWQGDGAVGAVKPLLRSRRPLRGLTYFPAPDTPAGTITFVQTLSDDTIALFGFDWSHPDGVGAP